MRESQLANLEAFLAVADARSFTRAAALLGVTASAVSQSVKRLEGRVGTPLFARTTRAVRLTDAGERLAERVAPALKAATGALDDVPVHGRGATGVLRLNVPRMAIDGVLMPTIARYLADNPDARVEITVEDALVDIVAKGFDAGVRLHEALADGMSATRISKRFRFLLVASPIYLALRGRPRRLDDLAHHECISTRLPSGAPYRWELEADNREVLIEPRGRMAVRGAAAGVAAARAGLGIAYADEPTVQSSLERGELEVVLAEHAAWVPGLFLYYPASTKRDPKIRAFVAACQKVQKS